jgi:hypothetical protein
MNITKLLIQLVFFSVLAFNIAFILGLITPEENPKALKKGVLRNIGFIYITVFFLAAFALLLGNLF